MTKKTTVTYARLSGDADPQSHNDLVRAMDEAREESALKSARIKEDWARRKAQKAS